MGGIVLFLIWLIIFIVFVVLPIWALIVLFHAPSWAVFMYIMLGGIGIGSSQT